MTWVNLGSFFILQISGFSLIRKKKKKSHPELMNAFQYKTFYFLPKPCSKKSLMCSRKTNVKNTYDLQQQRRSAACICWSTCSIYHHRCIWHLEKTIFLTLEAPLLQHWKYSLIFSLINFHSERNHFMWTVKAVTELYFFTEEFIYSSNLEV